MAEIINLFGQQFKAPQSVTREETFEEEPVQEPERRPARRQQGPRLKKVFSTAFLLAGTAAVGLGFIGAGQRFLFLEARANMGEAEAQYRLGKARFNTAAKGTDYLEAMNLLRKAADQGHVDAQSALGLIYAKGKIVKQNPVEALNWFRKAAQDSPAPHSLMFQTPVPVFNQFLEFCRKLDSRGAETACKNLEMADAAKGKTLRQIKTLDGSQYDQVQIQRVDPQALTIAFVSRKGGASFAKLSRAALHDDAGRLCRYSADATVAPFSVWIEPPTVRGSSKIGLSKVETPIRTKPL